MAERHCSATGQHRPPKFKGKSSCTDDEEEKEEYSNKIEDQLLERSHLRDAETDKIRKKGLDVHFLYNSKNINPNANAGQIFGWKRWDTGGA